MNRKLILLVLFLVALCLGYFLIKKDFPKTADRIYINGNILTLETNSPNAQAMFVVNGRIKAIGTTAEILAYQNKTIPIIDLKGKTILPGFIDSHTHVALSAFLENMVDLSGFTHSTAQEVWDHLENTIKERKAGAWIVCRGLDPILTSDLVVPNIKLLDQLAPNNPLVLISQSLHTYWVNSKTLEQVGITKATKDPSKSSYYERDSLGNLTGLIAEQEAFAPIIEAMKENVLSSAMLIQSTTKVLQNYAKHGNTSLVSTGLSIADAKPLRLYEHLSSDKASFMNQALSLLGYLPKRSAQARHFIYMRHDRAFLLPPQIDRGNDFYNIIGIKHWYDGSPYTGSMYLEAPYLVSELTKNGLHIPEGGRGKALLSKQELVQFIKNYHAKNWQIAIHAQGDIANQDILQAYEEVEKEMDIRKARHRLEHCLLVSPASIQKMKALNITPSFHINHLYYYGQALKEHIIGAERAAQMLPLAEAQNQGLKYSLHADQPMFESNPFRLIQTAVQRQTKEGETIGDALKITLLDAIKAMTIHAAWQIHMEDKIGSLKPGKYADFIILDQNPFDVPIENLETIKVLKTFVNGNELFWN